MNTKRRLEETRTVTYARRERIFSHIHTHKYTYKYIHAYKRREGGRMAVEEDRRHGKSNKRNFAYSTSGPAIRRRPPLPPSPSFAYTSRTANNLTRTPTVGHLPYLPNKIPPVPGLSCNARVARGPAYLSVAPRRLGKRDAKDNAHG